MENISWSNIQIFIGGKELKGVTSVSFLGKTYKIKNDNAIKRLKTVAEIIVNKHNLN